MGLSQQIGASSLIRPGVIDSSAQRPASPYEGQVIFQKDTDQMLVWNGTAWVIPNAPAQNPMGLELITPVSVAGTGVSLSGTTVTYTASTTNISVNGVFSSIYTNYCVMLTGSATSNLDCGVRLRAAGTDLNTSIYQYASNGWYESTQNSAGATAQTFIMLACSFGNGRTSSSKIEFFRPQTTDAWKTINANVAFSHAVVGVIVRNVAGNVNSATQCDGFTIVNAGNVTGSLTVYGYRNS